MIICLLTKGKGTVFGNSAHEAGVYLFESIRDAEIFKSKWQDLESKYWTRVQIIEPDTNVEIGYHIKDYLTEKPND